MFGKKRRLAAVEKMLDKLSVSMEQSKIRDYVYYLEHPRKIFFSNLLAGVARGFGASIGFTLLAALTVYMLQRAVRWNLPIIGKFISDIVNIVNNNLNNPGR